MVISMIGSHGNSSQRFKGLVWLIQRTRHTNTVSFSVFMNSHKRYYSSLLITLFLKSNCFTHSEKTLHFESFTPRVHFKSQHRMPRKVTSLCYYSLLSSKMKLTCSCILLYFYCLFIIFMKWFQMIVTVVRNDWLNEVYFYCPYHTSLFHSNTETFSQTLMTLMDYCRIFNLTTATISWHIFTFTVFE